MSIILISGSSSGIGRAITEQLLNLGHVVIGLARNHQKFTSASPHYITYTVDFSDLLVLEKTMRAIQKEYPLIEVIICCAGYGDFGELEQFSVSRMQRLMNVNFLSQVILIKTFLPYLKKQQKGKIILLGSECALEGQKKGSLYCASKFALRGFAQSLRKECAQANIAVTLINPGLVDTPFFDDLDFRPAKMANSFMEATQIADVVSLLLEEKNNCVFEEINMQPMKKNIEKNR